MPAICWQLVRGRPIVGIELISHITGAGVTRTLLADTGAGSVQAPMDLILSEEDCLQFRMRDAGSVRLGRAIEGIFRAHWVSVSIPQLRVACLCIAIAVPSVYLPQGLDGIACFRFLNRFAYGNFGNPSQFGLEMTTT